MTSAAETLDKAMIAKAHDLSITDVAKALGADKNVSIAERGVPCPGCGGDDRFSVDPDKNVFWCRASGSGGDPIDLVRHVHGVGFGEAVEMLTGDKALPAGKRRPQSQEKQNEYRRKAQERGYRIWRNGYSIEERCGGSLVRGYFELRGIPFPVWRVRTIREATRLQYWTWSKERQENIHIHTGPAMLAAITGPDGKFIGVHRTWLDLSRPDGKAVISDPETGEILDVKKVEGSQRGGRIVLRDGTEYPDLVIGEGIETVLSWDAIHRIGTAELWAGINLDNIAGKAAEQIPHPSSTITDRLGRARRAKVAGPDPDQDDRDCLAVPKGRFARVRLLGDGDSDTFATQAAMLRAERRREAEGYEASTCWAPDGHDWNDVLRSQAKGRIAA